MGFVSGWSDTALALLGWHRRSTAVYTGCLATVSRCVFDTDFTLASACERLAGALDNRIRPLCGVYRPLHLPQMFRRVRGLFGTFFYIAEVVGDLCCLFDLSERAEAIG